MGITTVTIERSAEWVAAQRLATGTNVPTTIEIKVDPAALSVAARQVLLAYGHGSYPSEFDGRHSDECHWGGGFWNKERPLIDQDNPDVAAIDAAILAADARLAGKRAKAELERAERTERERAEREAKAETARKLAAARELLAVDLAAGEAAKGDRRILADFLAEIPADALRGTLKRLAHSPEAVKALEEKIEDASPVTIFEDEDADEE